MAVGGKSAVRSGHLSPGLHPPGKPDSGHDNQTWQNWTTEGLTQVHLGRFPANRTHGQHSEGQDKDQEDCYGYKFAGCIEASHIIEGVGVVLTKEENQSSPQ